MATELMVPPLDYNLRYIEQMWNDARSDASGCGRSSVGEVAGQVGVRRSLLFDAVEQLVIRKAALDYRPSDLELAGQL
ncbi:hypothetical protein [Streptomyces sp. NPDC005485]|uniref:hypothetical protein n=1 Tax=Streptomyces sp. NPDC005485 TaxID=3155591 RepID=UPI0033BCDE57